MAAVGEPANAVALIRDLRHLESSGPCSLVVVAHVDLGTRGKGRPCVRIWRRPPSAHATIVLTFRVGRMTTTPDLVEERMRWDEGRSWVAGLDEVGRGAWAGPVTVGVAMLARGVSEDSMPPWLRDSKQLSEMRRESIFAEVGRVVR